MGYLPDNRRVEVRVLDPGDSELVPVNSVVRAAVIAGLDESFDFNRNWDADALVSLSVRNFAGRRSRYRVIGSRLVSDVANRSVL